MPLSEVIVGKIRPILLVLFSGAVLLLIIAAVNIASLLLARSGSRRREIAVRKALGASGARIFGQFVTEGLVLVAAGSMLGVAAASAVMQLLVQLIPADVLASMSYLAHIGWNIRMWAFAGVLALFAGVLFSFTPAVHLLRSEMRPGLTEGTRGTAGNAWRRLGSRLVVVELAIAMVLLVAAGLLDKSLYRLLGVDVGFEADRLLMLQVAAPRSSYANDGQTAAFARRVLDTISSLPGIQSVGLTTVIPIFRLGQHYLVPRPGPALARRTQRYTRTRCQSRLLHHHRRQAAARPLFSRKRRRIQAARRNRESRFGPGILSRPGPHRPTDFRPRF